MTENKEEKESMKSLIMQKLLFVHVIDFKTAVRTCIPFGRGIGADIYIEPKKFYALLFDAITTLESMKLVDIDWKDDTKRPGKRILIKMTISKKGSQWSSTSTFAE